MCWSYYTNNKHNDIAVFEVFFRKCPFKGEYAIFAGLSDVVSFILNYKLKEKHVKYIKNIMPEVTDDFIN